MVDQQNSDHRNVIRSEQTLQKVEITSEDVLNALNNMKTNNSPRSDMYLTLFKKKEQNAIDAFVSLSNKFLRKLEKRERQST